MKHALSHLNQMSDREIVAALLARDKAITEAFFYHKCYPLFKSYFDNYYTDCEDRTQYNSQEGRRTIEDTHDSAEDRTQSSDIEELYKEDSPRFHRNKVHAVRHSDGRCLRLFINTKHALHERSVENKSNHKDYE